MGKLTDKMKARHKAIREHASQEIFELMHQAVERDAEWQKNKPDLLKQIDDSLDRNVFRKLYT